MGQLHQKIFFFPPTPFHIIYIYIYPHRLFMEKYHLFSYFH